MNDFVIIKTYVKTPHERCYLKGKTAKIARMPDKSKHNGQPYAWLCNNCTIILCSQFKNPVEFFGEPHSKLLQKELKHLIRQNVQPQTAFQGVPRFLEPMQPAFWILLRGLINQRKKSPHALGVKLRWSKLRCICSRHVTDEMQIKFFVSKQKYLQLYYKCQDFDVTCNICKNGK